MIDPQFFMPPGPLPHIVLLPEPELHHEPAARPQHAYGCGEYGLDVIKTSGAPEESDVGFLQDVCRETPFIDVLHVGRVRRNDVEDAADAVEPGGADEFDPVGHRVTDGVLPGDVHRRLR